MKNLTRLFAIVLSVAMICSFATVSFADSINAMNSPNYVVFSIPAKITQGTTEFTVGFGIKDSRGNTIDITADSSKAFSNLYFSLDEGATSAGIVPTGITTTVGTNDTSLQYIDEYSFGTQIKFDKENVSLTAETAIINVTFTIPAEANVGTYKVAPFGGYDMGDVQDAAGQSGALSWDALDVVTVAAKQDDVTPSIEGTTANDQTGVAADGFVYDNAYAVSVTLKGVSAISEGGIEFVPEFVGDWAKAEKAVFDFAGLGKGDAEYKAALINIPRILADKSFNIKARPYFVASGNTTYGTETMQKFTYTITGEPAQD